jgi:hypothetical protein
VSALYVARFWLALQPNVEQLDRGDEVHAAACS